VRCAGPGRPGRRRLAPSGCLACSRPFPMGSPGQVAPCAAGQAYSGVQVEAGPLVDAGSIGRFEILPELAILTSEILGSDSSTTLVEKSTRPIRAATSVTRRGRSARPHPSVTNGHLPGKG
jgi:hypothetical protein